MIDHGTVLTEKRIDEALTGLHAENPGGAQAFAREILRLREEWAKAERELNEAWNERDELKRKIRAAVKELL